ncbi:phage exclusion lipoprotein Cor [Citrobacter freundii]
MKNIIIPVIVCLVLSACSGPVLEKQKPVCQAELGKVRISRSFLPKLTR